MNQSIRTGAMIAIAAAGLFGAACKQADDARSGAAGPAGSGAAQTSRVECHGVNACKGKSACMTAANECSGQNACKGKGWLSTTAESCKAKGGTITAMTSGKSGT